MSLSETLIVFYCDGTLVDSQHLIAEAMRRAFLSAGASPPQRAEILRAVGLSMPETLGLLAAEYSEEKRDKIAQAYKEWCFALRQQPNMAEPMFTGAASLLLDLAAREGVILGLATGKSRRGVARFIEHNGLEGVFSTLQTADDAPSKPHPAMLLQAMKETGIPPEKTVMIGDTSYDMLMAACAKVASVGVSWGYHSVADLEKAGAGSIVHSFSALACRLNASQAVTASLGAVA